MLLAIDSGNTHLVFALYEGEKKHGQWRLKNEPQRPADEYIVFLNQWLSMSGLRLKDIQDVIISSVVPETLFHLKHMVKGHFTNPPLVVGEASIDVGVKVKIDKPHTLGADRLVNAFGGFRKYGGPLIIIDFGTATTFDIIDEQGSYIGGIIAPGVALSLKALYEGAAKLPPITFARTNHVIATTTASAMQAGCYWGYIGMIEGLYQRVREEYQLASKASSKMTVVATGGLAAIFSRDLPLIDYVNEALTLDSLAELYLWRLSAE